MEKPSAVIFDMDGTLVDVSEIRHLVTADPKQKDFDAFHRESVNCPSHKEVVADLESWWEVGEKILIVTARSDKYKANTGFWLAMHEIPHDALFMRSEGDYRPDYEVKKDILRTIRQAYDPWLAYDDNPSVIQLWREEKITTIRVPGWED